MKIQGRIPRIKTQRKMRSRMLRRIFRDFMDFMRPSASLMLKPVNKTEDGSGSCRVPVLFSRFLRVHYTHRSCRSQVAVFANCETVSCRQSGRCFLADPFPHRRGLHLISTGRVLLRAPEPAPRRSRSRRTSPCRSRVRRQDRRYMPCRLLPQPGRSSSSRLSPRPKG